MPTRLPGLASKEGGGDKEMGEDKEKRSLGGVSVDKQPPLEKEASSPREDDAAEEQETEEKRLEEAIKNMPTTGKKLLCKN